MIPLDLLQSGEVGRVVAIEGEASLANRLEEMGLREGVLVRMVRPGSPCIVAVDDHRLSFRGENAAAVLVEPVAAALPGLPVA